MSVKLGIILTCKTRCKGLFRNRKACKHHRTTLRELANVKLRFCHLIYHSFISIAHSCEINLRQLVATFNRLPNENITPFTRAKKNRHGTPNFWHRADDFKAQHSQFSTCKGIGPKCNVAPVLKILGVPRLPSGGSLGAGKRGTVPKIWRAVPIFLARVNGVYVKRS